MVLRNLYTRIVFNQEDIEKIAQSCFDYFKHLLEDEVGVDLERLLEIVKAEKENRLIIKE